MEWTRPDNIPFPNVWSSFEGLREINGKKPKFWIQDVTEDLTENLLNEMKTGFVNEEPLCKFSKLSEDLISLAEASELYSYFIGNKLSCVCMTNDLNGVPKAVGISILTRTSADQPPFYPQTKTLHQLLSINDYAFNFKDIYNTLGITEYLDDKGIYVLPEYRKQGIAHELLKCWSVIGKAVGLKASFGLFTSIFSQGVANRAGFNEWCCFDYVELGRVNPEFYLPGIEKHTKQLKVLYKTF